MNPHLLKLSSHSIARSPRHRTAGERGFALVVTLSLLILLTVVAVGLLSLSSVSLRAGRQSSAQAEAKANARLALMLAIGELQNQMGPDQRVSASGAITDTLDPTDGSVTAAAKNPHWTGVWNSWKAGPYDPADPSPDDASAHQTIPASAVIPSGMSPTYTENRYDHFRSWLLSLNPDEATDIASARDLALDPALNPDVVRLVGPGSLGAAAATADFVNARLLKVNSSATGSPFRGRYGWWVGDESQKARLMGDSHVTHPDAGTPLPLASRLSRQQAPGSMGTRSIQGLENITNDITTEQKITALPSLGTSRLIDGATEDAEHNFHHATPFSYQILTDVREGGLKRDLSTLLERPINIAETGDDFMLYKFNDKERVPFQDLSAYFQLYRADVGDAAGNKGVQYSSSIVNGIANGLQITSPDFGNATTFNPKLQRQYTTLYRSPVPIKMQFMLGLKAAPFTGTVTYPGNYKFSTTISLGLTLWNPTNLPLVVNNSSSLFQRFRLNHLALGLKWTKNGWTNESEYQNILSPVNANPYPLLANISSAKPLVFAPGEVKVLSIPYVESFNFNNVANMTEGWDPRGFISNGWSARATKADGTPDADSVPPHISNKALIFTYPGDTIQLTVNATGTPIGFRAGRHSRQVSAQMTDIQGFGSKIITIKA